MAAAAASTAGATFALAPYEEALQARMRQQGLFLERSPVDESVPRPPYLDYETQRDCDSDFEDDPLTWLLEGGRSLADPEPVLVCRVCREGKDMNVRLGEDDAGVESAAFAARLPRTATIQALLQPWEPITFRGRPTQVCVLYTKERVFMFTWHPARWDSLLVPVGFFPPAPSWPLPAGTSRFGSELCDVWSTVVDLPVRQPLDEHAAKTADRPIPRYQMIIDPNQFVRDRPDGSSVWVPCEFDVSADGSARLVGGGRSHLYPELVDAVATPVLAAAMPLLAKLRRPRLLLAERRLQVVVKAQRIIVPPTSGDGADSEYVGLWHVDGDSEHVAAVVLYYYNVDPDLEGGDMEFCGREPFDVLGLGDASNNHPDVGAETLRPALRGGPGQENFWKPAKVVHERPVVPNCRVPVGTGTLLVFSNYQMVHRVLRMVNRSAQREASRDFVALFVIDPAEPLVPARRHLASQFALRRTLAAKRVGAVKFKDVCVQQVMEFEGSVPSDANRLRKRRELLRAQLQPKGQFGNLGGVYSTGNGCYTMIGWLDALLGEVNNTIYEDMKSSNRAGFRRLEGLNLAPTQVGRGMSEILSISSSQLKARLEEGGGSEDEDEG